MVTSRAIRPPAGSARGRAGAARVGWSPFGRRREPGTAGPAPPGAPERPPPLLLGGGGGPGVVIAQALSGEGALPSVGNLALLPLRRLGHHVLIMGATGAGKSESALRIAWALAKATDVAVFYLDAKGDRLTAERFCGLMEDAGRRTRVFPNEPMDGWRGDQRAIANRLLEVVDYARIGPAAWYRDVAKATLALACTHPDGPPRSSGQLLARLDRDQLRKIHGAAGAAGAITTEQVRQVRLRYEAFFGQAGRALDGDWGWEDTDAGYLLLDSLALHEEAATLGRFVLEDFAHYFSTRKPRERQVVLVVDEFSALAQSGRMASLIEQARVFNTGLVLAPQVAEGMGDPAEAQRILGSVETVICHRVNTPGPICELAGTRRRIEQSSHYDSSGQTGEGSARVQHQFTVDPNRVRRLANGEAYVIAHGRATRVQMLQAPSVTRALPGIEHTDRPPADGANAPARLQPREPAF